MGPDLTYKHLVSTNIVGARGAVGNLSSKGSFGSSSQH